MNIGTALQQAHSRVAARRHGHSKVHTGRAKSPEYSSWAAMIQRCQNRNDKKHWPLYGGRGIRVCKRWRVFENFLADMGERLPNKTLDRFPNPDGNYEPGNCRWATKEEQTATQRRRQKR